MSEIMSALRVLELEQHDHPAITIPSQPKLMTFAVNSDDFAALDQFTSVRTMSRGRLDPQPFVTRQQLSPAVLTPSAFDSQSPEEANAMHQLLQQDQTADTNQPEDVESITVSASDLNALEERIVRAVELVQGERQIRLAAEERAARAEAELSQKSPRIEGLERELRVLKGTRDHGRVRMDRLVAMLDKL